MRAPSSTIAPARRATRSSAPSKDWIDELAKAARIAVSEGHFRTDLDPDQFAFELYSIMLGAHLFMRFLREPSRAPRTHEAFERLVAAARAAPPRPQLATALAHPPGGPVLHSSSAQK